MIAARIFALAALIPAAFGAGPALAGSITARLCTGDGQVVTMEIPLSTGGSVPGDDARPCCAKGCHAGGSRKRLSRTI